MQSTLVNRIEMTCTNLTGDHIKRNSGEYYTCGESHPDRSQNVYTVGITMKKYYNNSRSGKCSGNAVTTGVARI